MYILVAYYYFFIEESQSLKQKRRIIKSVIDSLRHTFKLSVAEVKYQNDHKQAGVGTCCISAERNFLGNLKVNIDNYLQVNYPGRLQKSEVHIEDVRDMME